MQDGLSAAAERNEMEWQSDRRLRQESPLQQEREGDRSTPVKFGPMPPLPKISFTGSKWLTFNAPGSETPVSFVFG